MTPADLKSLLEDALDKHIPFKECVYVNWCHYANSGDHFIAAGSFKYLKDRHIDVKEIYANKQIKFNGQPIVSQGGGNLGDVFYNHEVFRCDLIKNNHQSPIVIFPQSVYFKDHQKAKASSDIYNAHPNITIFLREQKSFEIAQGLFGNCKLVLCPDSAWYLNDIVGDLLKSRLKENDALVRFYDHISLQDHQGSYWSDQVFFDWLEYFKGKALFSVAITIGAILQLSQCKNLVTERLHGHIMACMMKIPNKLLPVSYHKNSSTYETWTRHLPNTHFAGVDDRDMQMIKL